MARQVGPVFATGTIDGIIFYKLGDQYYMRSKGVYKSGKQMRKDPRLQRTMQKADQFRTAVKLLKPLYYRHLPRAVRKYGLFGQLTGMVNGWLQQGKSKEEAKELLLAYCETLIHPSKATETVPTVKSGTPAVQPLATPTLKAAAPEAQPQSIANTMDVTQKLVKPITPRVKQARYLSDWKVRRNGRLHIPQHRAAACLLTVKPLACHSELVSESDLGLERPYDQKNE